MHMRHGVKLIVTSAAALVATAALPATAQSAPAAAARTAPVPDAARLALARSLSALLNSDEMVTLQIDKMFEQSIPAAFAADPQVAALEREYPGVIVAVIGAMRPIMLASLEARLPELREQLAVFYAQEMSEDELAATIAFFRSPVGQKFVRLLSAGVDYSSMLQTFTQDPDAKITAQDMQTVVMSGLASAQRGMTPAEQAEIMRFERSPAGRKVGQLGPRIQAMTAQWANESDPAVDAAIEAAVVKAVTDFVAQAKK